MKNEPAANRDERTIESFGDEWTKYDQSGMSADETARVFADYFAVFPFDSLPADAVGFDMGCGSGRWSGLLADRVGHLHCIDPSAAIEVARARHQGREDMSFHHAGVDEQVLPPESQDFGVSLGVLHHLPDPAEGLRSCVRLLKPGGAMLIYIYYAFDNRSPLFRMIWRVSDLMRRAIHRMPPGLKAAVTDIIAALVYFPLAQLSRLVERLGGDSSSIPLNYYRNHTFYTMRTDSRDRFGTPLEHRYSRQEIQEMMTACDLTDISFSEEQPYWCAVGFKRASEPSSPAGHTASAAD